MTRSDYCPLSIAVAAAFLAMTGVGAADTINRCARLGADYAAVSGSNSCVRLGGHVRVELNRNQLTPNLAPMGYAAQDGIQPAAARIAHQPMAPMTPFEMFPR